MRLKKLPYWIRGGLIGGLIGIIIGLISILIIFLTEGYKGYFETLNYYQFQIPFLLSNTFLWILILLWYCIFYFVILSTLGILIGFIYGELKKKNKIKK